jgi:MFS family permease
VTAIAGRSTSLGSRYWRLWTATTASSLGDGLELAALPLLAASLSRDPRLVAGVATAATLPWLVFTLFAGVIVDRFDRRVLMRRASLVRGSLAAVIAVAVAAGLMVLPLLYLLVFLLGIGQTLFDSAAQAILPDLVAAEHIPRANSRQQVGEMTGATFAGPPLGGILFAALAPAPFAADAAVIAVALLLVSGIRGSYSPHARAAPEPAAASARRSVRAEIGEGMRWLFRHRLLRTLALVLSLANLAIYLTEGILVLFAIRDLSLSKQGYGFLLTSIAVGGLLGGAVGARVSAALGSARTIVLTVAVIGACYLAVGLLSQPVVVAVVIAFAGFATSVWNIVTISLRQALIPRPLMGRVNSAYRLIGMGSLPVGTVLGGVLAHAFGLRFPFFAAAALLFVAVAGAGWRISERSVAAARLEAGTP